MQTHLISRPGAGRVVVVVSGSSLLTCALTVSLRLPIR